MMLEGVRAWQPLDITMLQHAAPGAWGPAAAGAAAGPAGPAGAAATGAGNLLNNFQAGLMEGLRGVNEAQAGAMQTINNFLEGKGPALHTVMLSLDQANLSLEFAVQMRNKIMDAYTEIMRMQV